MTASQQAQPIEIRVEGVEQLFNTLDPFPFPERDYLNGLQIVELKYKSQPIFRTFMRC